MRKDMLGSVWVVVEDGKNNVVVRDRREVLEGDILGESDEVRKGGIV